MSIVNRKSLSWLACLALVLSIYTSSNAAWIVGKASIAQYLLQISWNQSLNKGYAIKPWSWADVQTIGRLYIPTADQSLIVLSDASGEAMAFGPGLVGGDPQLALSNTLAIGGHRDTHLKFLEHLPAEAFIEFETIEHGVLRYQLVDKQIVDTRKTTLTISQQTPGLVLITCYPFNASQTGGPLRMVARAVLAKSPVKS